MSHLRAGTEVYAWMAEVVRLLFDDNRFPPIVVEKLREHGYDVDKVTDPRLSYAERRPDVPLPVRGRRRGVTGVREDSAPAVEGSPGDDEPAQHQQQGESQGKPGGSSAEPIVILDEENDGDIGGEAEEEGSVGDVIKLESRAKRNRSFNAAVQYPALPYDWI